MANCDEVYDHTEPYSRSSLKQGIEYPLTISIQIPCAQIMGDEGQSHPVIHIFFHF